MVMTNKRMETSIMEPRKISRVFTHALPSIAALTITHSSLAQRYNQRGTFAGLACCSSAAIAFPIAVIVLNVFLLIWVARDAKSRGMDNSVLWMLLVLATSFIGLIIYLSVRPKGEFVPCPNCGGNKLPVLVRCPHCGAGA